MKNNDYIKNAIKVWTITLEGVGDTVFCLIENKGEGGGYLVRYLDHSEFLDSDWLEGGPWETESGAAWAILNIISSENQE